MGDEPRADISAKWEFKRFEGLITRNPHRPRILSNNVAMDSKVKLLKVGQFFDETGTLLSIPAKQSKKLAVLRIIAGAFDPNSIYSEKELNAILSRFNDDTAAIRRHMIEFGIMERNKESYYWLKEVNNG